MKAIIGETESLRSFAILNRVLPRHSWKEQIEKFVTDKRVSGKFEIHVFESIGRKLGMDVKKYDSLPYGEFLDALHSALQVITNVKIETDGGYQTFVII